MKLARRLVMRRSMQNIADLVKDSVANNPLEKLQAIATRLDVDRHTLARALRRYQGISFRELQRLALQQRVHVLMSPGHTTLEKASSLRVGLRIPFVAVTTPAASA
jgi:methylphosphotriester-DNA--protein-cysteine methyltransferase